MLSLIGGIFILLNGLLIAALGALASFIFIPGGVPVLAWGIMGIVFALIVIVGAFVLHSNPDQHMMWGAIILIFSIISIVIGGGFIIGMILGSIGGVLALVSEA